MTYKIFYSWQNDTLPKNNRSFIRDALQQAIQSIGGDTDLQDADRPDLALDHDTKDVPGSPELVNTILAKIRQCAVFVPDITFIGETADGTKRLSNPNVLIELGFAAEVVGFDRFVMVINEAFGSAQDYLPFDLQHRRFPIKYNLPPDADAKTRRSVKASLVNDLAEAIRLIIGNIDQSSGVENLPATEPVFRSSSFLNDGEEIATISDVDEDSRDICWFNGPQAFLRVIPVPHTETWNPHELRAMLMQRPNLPSFGRPQNCYIEPNRFGAVIFSASTSDYARNFTQVFRSGEIWGLGALPLDAQENSGLPLGYLHEVFHSSLQDYLRFCSEHLGVKPAMIIAGLSEIENYGIYDSLSRVNGQCFQAEIIHEAKISEENNSVEEMLAPLFEQISVVCGVR